MDVDWNMNGEPEWRDEMAGAILPGEIDGIKTLYIPNGEYWVLLRTMDGWRLVTDNPLPTLEKAKENIQHRSPGAYKILHTTESYKTQVALLPLTED